jgi:hypothetical protein
MKIEDEIKSAIYRPIWYSVHKALRDIVWSSVHDRIDRSFLQCGQLMFRESEFRSVHDIIHEYKF